MLTGKKIISMQCKYYRITVSNVPISGKTQVFLYEKSISQKASGVARGRLCLGAKIILRPHQKKLQSLNWKIGAKARKNQKQNISYLSLLLLFRSKKTRLTLEMQATNLYQQVGVTTRRSGGGSPSRPRPMGV